MPISPGDRITPFIAVQSKKNCQAWTAKLSDERPQRMSNRHNHFCKRSHGSRIRQVERISHVRLSLVSRRLPRSLSARNSRNQQESFQRCEYNPSQYVKVTGNYLTPLDSVLTICHPHLALYILMGTVNRSLQHG